MDQMDYGMEGEGSPEMDDYGQEGGAMVEGQMMGDEYDQEGEEEEEEDDEESINFDANPEYAHLPPLDKNRKIRREVLRTINEVRAKFASTNSLNHDFMLSLAAEEYA